VTEPTAEAGPPKKGKGLPKKILGLPTPVVLAGAAAIAALIIIRLRSKKTAAAGTAVSGAACTDANGNQGTTDTTGACITNTGSTTSTTDESGQPCTDSSGNPGMTDALGNCISTGGLSTAAGSTGGSSGGSGDPGTTGDTGVGTTGGDTGTTGTTTTTTAPPAAATVAVPDVRNEQVNTGIAKITAAGLKYHLSSERNPADTYIINSQTPAPGSKVAKGSSVDLGIAPHKF
jgi:hypothetical protein